MSRSGGWSRGSDDPGPVIFRSSGVPTSPLLPVDNVGVLMGLDSACSSMGGETRIRDVPCGVQSGSGRRYYQASQMNACEKFQVLGHDFLICGI